MLDYFERLNDDSYGLLGLLSGFASVAGMAFSIIYGFSFPSVLIRILSIVLAIPVGAVVGALTCAAAILCEALFLVSCLPYFAFFGIAKLGKFAICKIIDGLNNHRAKKNKRKRNKFKDISLESSLSRELDIIETQIPKQIKTESNSEASKYSLSFDEHTSLDFSDENVKSVYNSFSLKKNKLY